MKKYVTPVLVLFCVLALVIGRAFQDTDHADEYETPNFHYETQPDEITCGPTSAAMLLQYYGKDVTIQQVAERARTKWFTWDGKNIGMTSPDYMEVAIRHFGVPCKMRRGSLTNLKSFVSHGRPCVVLVRSGQTTWHYVVVIGYTKDQIIMADPGDGSRFEMPVSTFVGCWGFDTDMEGRECGHGDPVWGRVDPLRNLLWAGEVYPNTMIVPEKSR